MATFPQTQGWVTAIAWVVNTLGIICGISVGMWFAMAGFWVYFNGLIGGGMALAVSTWITGRIRHAYRLPSMAGVLLAVGGLQLLVFSGLLFSFLPAYYASLGQPSQPISLSWADIPAHLPPLPAYVSIDAYPQPDLAVIGRYRTLGNRRISSPPKTYTVTWLPIVPADWQASAAVMLMAEQAAVGRSLTVQKPTTVTGVLFSLPPQPGERFVPTDVMLYFSPGGIGVSDTWLRRQAQFELAPTPIYLLRATTPQQLRQPLVILTALLLVYLGGMVWFCLRWF